MTTENTVILQQQERSGCHYQFNGNIVMTANFSRTFEDNLFFIVLESLAKIRELTLNEEGADYFQVLTFNNKKYWVIQDGPEDRGLITFLMPEDY